MRRFPFFWWLLAGITGLYLLFWGALVGATATFSSPPVVAEMLGKGEIRYAIGLSLFSCTAAAALALLVAVPVGYLMARGRFVGKGVVDALLDVPIVLPPMVVGICLLIFFQTRAGHWLEQVLHIQFTYTVAGVVLAQFVVAAAFAIRTMRGTFDHLSPRPEQVALTLGATPARAFWHVALPSARRGMVAAFCIAWARSLGEFGPVLVFAGATRKKTEVMPTTVWLEMSVGNLESAVAVSLVMIAVAMVVLVLVRALGEKL